MYFYNNIFVVCMIASLLPFQWIEATENCQIQTQKIKDAVNECQKEFNRESYNDILAKIPSSTLTVEELTQFADANCPKIDEITACVIRQKNLLADGSCKTDVAYNREIFTLNHVIRLNLFVCGRSNGDLLKAMIPNNGLKCFYGNENYINCVRDTESNSDLPDICANIDVRMNCLHTANDCENKNAVESFRNLFLLYKEKIEC